MSAPDSGRVTRLLAAARRGDKSAGERLWELVQSELHRVARAQVARESPSHRRDATSLVHEAYLRLFGGQRLEFADRQHFFRFAARVMRCVLIEDARKRKGLRHGGGLVRLPLSEDPAARVPDPSEALAVDDALKRLKQIDPRRAEIVSLRYFAGLTVEETAAALGVSQRTVASEWRFARAWLRRELAAGGSRRVEAQKHGASAREPVKHEAPESRMEDPRSAEP